ncbi:MAG: Rrf2 family transcriptional regulator [Halanaerobiaceae bacterium]|nr:Rrf2 family transcriptional regulator [Halanaerobiaceae bacterium]
MRISTRGRYGLRAIIDLANNEYRGAIPLREISQRQNISEQYLEQLFASLRKSGLVKSIRGAHGGYLLNDSPEKITVKDILTALEGPIAPADCVLSEDILEKCNNGGNCVTRKVWIMIKENLEELLDSVTLAELKAESQNWGDYDQLISYSSDMNNKGVK